MKQINIGIIGIGNMGSAHARMISSGEIEGLNLQAVADTNPQRCAWARENLPGNIRIYTEADALLADKKIEAVLIAVPHYDHEPLTVAALDRGLHVLCEKPVAVTTSQARAMHRAADRSGKIFALMFNQRTNPLFQKARRLVQGGEIGPLRRTSWHITSWYRPQNYYDSGDWRATWSGEGGGVLLNQCPHNLDLWQWICGMPRKITAFCLEGRWHDIEVEDDVTAFVEYENGATGTFITSTGDTPGTDRLEIVGDAGKIVIENDEMRLYRLQIPESEFSRIYKGGFGEPEHTVEIITAAGDYPKHAGVLRAFTEAIIAGRPLVADGREGINSLTLSNAMHLSSWLRRTIELPLDEKLFNDELAKRVKNSRRKTGGNQSFAIEASW